MRLVRCRGLAATLTVFALATSASAQAVAARPAGHDTTTQLINARSLGGQVVAAAAMAGFPVRTPPTFQGHDAVSVIVAAATTAAALQKQALTRMTPDLWARALRGTKEAALAIVRPKNKPAFMDPMQWPTVKADIDSVNQIDRAMMWQATVTLAAGIDQALPLIRAGKTRTSSEPIPTPLGDILIDDRNPANGGCDNTYNDPTFLTIDECGNDTYGGSAGSANSTRADPISIIIDTNGNDTTMPTPGSFGAGTGAFGGIAAHVDTVGNDVIGDNNRTCNDVDQLGPDIGFVGGVGYVGGHGILADFAGDDTRCVTGLNVPKFGAGFVGGVGMLIDNAGNDVYGGDTFEQGSGWFANSFGLLFDAAGRDSIYDYSTFSQGSGGVGGFGVLLNAGSDPDLYRGNSELTQGAGGCGGAGLLLDMGGNDRYEAVEAPETVAFTTQGSTNAMGCTDEFGGGLLDQVINALPEPLRSLLQQNASDVTSLVNGLTYAPAIGILADNGGSDTFLGDSLTQGSHYGPGIGALLKNGGNDTYSAKECAQGFGNSGDAGPIRCRQRKPWLWPLPDFPVGGAGLLVDSGGGDSYFVNGLGQGEGFGYSLAGLIDLGGTDRYSSSVVDNGGAQARGSTGIAIDRNLL